jgi:CRISPR system Cascade subunit CasE
MYLTQITLSNSEAVQQHFFDPWQWHSTLWKSFKVKERKVMSDIYLFRVDQNPDQTTFLLQSRIPPVAQSWGSWQTKVIPAGFFDREHYYFSLRAYPAVKKVVKKQRQGVRIPHADPIKWLKDKASENGFELERVSIRKKCCQSASKGYQVAVDFEGILVVKNKESFIQAVTKGIGPSKAYGLGLLLLKSI